MAKQVINLGAGGTSAQTVPALKFFGVVTNLPISIKFEGTADVKGLGRNDTKAIYATSDSIVITASLAGTVVTLTTEG